MLRTPLHGSLLAVALACGVSAAGAQTGQGQASRGVQTAQPATKSDPIFYKGSYALIVGVSKYTAGWPQLPGVLEDVAAVDSALAAQGFETTVVRSPTRAEFDAALREFISAHGFDPDNRLVIYFAGHGETVKMPDGRQAGYLVPADAPLATADAVKFDELAISMDMLDTQARRIRAKHALFVFDSCFSGTLFTSMRGVPPSISERVRQPVRQFITAGSADQQVPDRSDFRRSFVEALSGDADMDKDGYVTGTELGYWLEQQVTNYSRGAQTPQYGKIRDAALDKGDFVFVVGKAATANVPPAAKPPSPPDDAGLARREELAFWESVKDARDRQAIESYIKKYPKGRYLDLARLRLLEFDRQDPRMTALRFLDAVAASDIDMAWELLLPSNRQSTTREAFAAAFKPFTGGPDGERSVLYSALSPQAAVFVFKTPGRVVRVVLANSGVWGVFAAVFNAPPPPDDARTAALRFLGDTYRSRFNEAYSQVFPQVRTQVSLDNFKQIYDGIAKLGAPASRELVYSEWDASNPAVPGAWLVYRSRFGAREMYESVNLAGKPWTVTQMSVLPVQ
jgi:caspase domain-containing protein